MNYSTLKKTVVLSFVSLVLVGMAFAQTNTTTPAKKMSDSVTTAKLFGGASQYNTWSVGINLGVTASPLVTGGTDKFHNGKGAFGYGVSIKDQISHAFAIQFNYNGGTVEGDNSTGTAGLSSPAGFTSFSTTYNAFTLNGVINVGNISFLHRKNKIGFFVSGGMGLINYTPSFGYAFAAPAGFTDLGNNQYKYTHSVSELIIPIGVGAKYRLTDNFDLKAGYTENFLDGFNFTGDKAGYPSVHDHYSYGYVGVDYTFGKKGKPSLEWVNPIAMMYDELYDQALRQEVEALKGRVKNVEGAVADFKKDSDGDGVADQFDKCPNTPAGTVVDGSGCPIVFPKPCPCDTAGGPDDGDKGGKEPEPLKKAEAFDNIEFEFDSSVLKKVSYPILEATVADLKKSGKKITIAGYASSEGTPSYNMRLSKDRATAVKDWLINSGLNPKQVKIKGYGETHPIADNSTEEGRIKNRRVEFKK